MGGGAGGGGGRGHVSRFLLVFAIFFLPLVDYLWGCFVVLIMFAIESVSCFVLRLILVSCVCVRLLPFLASVCGCFRSLGLVSDGLRFFACLRGCFRFLRLFATASVSWVCLRLISPSCLCLRLVMLLAFAIASV